MKRRESHTEDRIDQCIPSTDWLRRQVRFPVARAARRSARSGGQSPDRCSAGEVTQVAERIVSRVQCHRLICAAAPARRLPPVQGDRAPRNATPTALLHRGTNSQQSVGRGRSAADPVPIDHVDHLVRRDLAVAQCLVAGEHHVRVYACVDGFLAKRRTVLRLS